LIINALVYYALIAIYDLHPHGAWVLSVVSDHAYSLCGKTGLVVN
jgi:hypothetical protein